MVVNSVVAHNTALTGGGGMHFGANGDVELRNTVVAFNTGDAGLASDGVDPLIEYCDVYGNALVDYGPAVTDVTGMFGNLSDDPLFITYSVDLDWTNDDLHLQTLAGGFPADSPCLDAGDPAPGYDDPNFTPNDMGAYGGPYGGW
jgi:hypothetical protein